MKDLMISCLDSRVDEDGVMYGRFLFGPTPRGLAVTIASALRRSLLSEVVGFAITHVEFSGPKHEYSTLPGTQETVLDVLLNLKKLTFTATRPVLGNTTSVGYCSGYGQRVLTGRDLKLPPGVQCTSPDVVIAHLADEGQLDFAFLLASGTNYVIHKGASKSPAQNQRQKLVRLAEALKNPRAFRVAEALKYADRETRKLPRRKRREKEDKKAVEAFRLDKALKFARAFKVPRSLSTEDTAVFPIDAVFMPVLRVNYVIHSDEDVLDFPLHCNSLEVTERVIFEIWTNGDVTPREAMHQAASQLVRLFSLFQKSPTPSFLFRPAFHKERIKVLKYTVEKKHGHTLESSAFENAFLALDIGILPISPTLFSELKRREIHRLGDFLHKTYEDLAKIPGMTTEVLFEVLCVLRSYGVRFRPTIRNIDDLFALPAQYVPNKDAN